MRSVVPLLVSAALASAPLAARAGAPHPLRHDVAIDGAVTGAAAAAWIGTELAKRWLAPEACRWCEPGALDEGARDALAWGDGAPARHASDLLAFAVLPGGVAAHQLLAARAAGDAEAGAVDLLLVAEAGALAADLNQAVKFAVGRQRPFVRHGRDPGRAHDPDDDLSFYSGHTTLAFSLAAAAGTVSDLRGYRSAPWVWGAGMTAAATVGWLRIAADKHYLSDVLTGAIVGTAVGVLVPRAFHGREPAAGAAAQPAAAPLGFALAF